MIIEVNFMIESNFSVEPNYFTYLIIEFYFIIFLGLFDPDMVITNEHNIGEISSVAKVIDSANGK